MRLHATARRKECHIIGGPLCSQKLTPEHFRYALSGTSFYYCPDSEHMHAIRLQTRLDRSGGPIVLHPL